MSFRALVLQPHLREQARLEKPRGYSATPRNHSALVSPEESETDQPAWERSSFDLRDLNRKFKEAGEQPCASLDLPEALLSPCEHQQWSESLELLSSCLGEGGPRRLELRQWLQSVA